MAFNFDYDSLTVEQLTELALYENIGRRSGYDISALNTKLDITEATQLDDDEYYMRLGKTFDKDVEQFIDGAGDEQYRVTSASKAKCCKHGPPTTITTTPFRRHR